MRLPFIAFNLECAVSVMAWFERSPSETAKAVSLPTDKDANGSIPNVGKHCIIMGIGLPLHLSSTKLAFALIKRKFIHRRSVNKVKIAKSCSLPKQDW